MPFPDPHGDGWEDDEDQPRCPRLATALETTWRIVDHCLERWTPGNAERDIRTDEARLQTHSRTSSFSDFSVTMRITAANCHRRLGWPACVRSTSGARKGSSENLVNTVSHRAGGKRPL